MADTESGGRFSIAKSRIVGFAAIALGALLVVLAYSAQSSVDEIGPQTTDPVLKERVAMFEDQRDLFLVTSIGSLFIGLFALAVLGEASTPTAVPSTQMVSAARMADNLVTGLSLAGNSTFLPRKKGLTRERMFVPSAGTGDLPQTLSDDLILSPGKDGSTPGIVVEPLGLRLLDNIESEIDIALADAGIEAVEGGLQVLKHGMGIMKDFHLKERDGGIVLRVEYSGLSDACSSIRKDRPSVCRQVPCVGCSCILTALARSTGRAVSIRDVDNKEPNVVFTLDLRDW